MKKFLSIVFLWLVSMNVLCGAQEYYVYSVSGKVLDMESKTIVPCKRLCADAVVDLKKGSRIILIAIDNSELYTIKGESKGCIRNLLANEEVIRKKVSPQYVEMLLKKSSTSESRRNGYMQSSTNVYRDVDSSILKKSLGVIGN